MTSHNQTLAPSCSLAALGSSWLEPFTAVKMPGKILWFNFALAREMGFACQRLIA